MTLRRKLEPQRVNTDQVSQFQVARRGKNAEGACSYRSAAIAACTYNIPTSPSYL